MADGDLGGHDGVILIDGDTAARAMRVDMERRMAEADCVLIHQGRLHARVKRGEENSVAGDWAHQMIAWLENDNYAEARRAIRHFYASYDWGDKTEWREQTLAAIENPNSYVLVEAGTVARTPLAPVDWEQTWEHGPRISTERMLAAISGCDIDVAKLNEGGVAIKLRFVSKTYVRRQCDGERHEGGRAFADGETFYHRDDDYDLCQHCFDADASGSASATAFSQRTQEAMPLWAEYQQQHSLSSPLGSSASTAPESCNKE